MENLVATYNLPKDIIEVFCVIILYLQPFQILKWRKVYATIFKSSLQNLRPLPPRLKVKSTDLAISWT